MSQLGATAPIVRAHQLTSRPVDALTPPSRHPAFGTHTLALSSNCVSVRPMTHDEWTGVAQAVAATLCSSTGAVLVRWAAAVSPVAVTGLRLLLAAAFVGLAAW